jgi:predicted nucleic acid-binding protein
MNGRYVLDTNIVIALFANDKNVISSIENSENVISNNFNMVYTLVLYSSSSLFLWHGFKDLYD